MDDGIPQALEAFEKGLAALSKVYVDEAEAHFEEALRLDPAFAAPKVFLLQRVHQDPARRDAEIAELRHTDLDTLSPRERFLVRRLLAAHDREAEEVVRITDDYLRQHPDDPYALDLEATRAFNRGEWTEAEAEYKRLVEIVPNRVLAYNQMGYAQMAQGRFAEAEATFIRYRFIAPDQANPHDSLGELLALTGHYDQAEREFRDALAVKPDFSASYTHLVSLAVMRGAYDEAGRVIAEAEAKQGFPPSALAWMRRSVAVWEAASKRRWDDLARLAAETSWKDAPDLEILAHDVLLGAGRADAAKAIEAAHATLMAEESKAGSEGGTGSSPFTSRARRCLRRGTPRRRWASSRRPTACWPTGTWAAAPSSWSTARCWSRRCGRRERTGAPAR